MGLRSNKIFTAQALNRRASLIVARQDADAATDELLAVTYATELDSLKAAADQGLFYLDINVSEYEDVGAELVDLVERYGFQVEQQPPTDIRISWLPAPVINDTPTAAPVITTVTPAFSSIAGTTVTVTGTGFTGVTSVIFSSDSNTITLQPEDYTVLSGNEMTINVPAASLVGYTGTVPYAVTFNIVNTLGSSLDEAWAYVSIGD